MSRYIMSFTEEEKRQLLESIKRLGENISDLEKIIRGASDSPVPKGLLWTSQKNTDFRKNVTRWLWGLSTLITALIVERLLSVFGG